VRSGTPATFDITDEELVWDATDDPWDAADHDGSSHRPAPEGSQTTSAERAARDRAGEHVPWHDPDEELTAEAHGHDGPRSAQPIPADDWTPALFSFADDGGQDPPAAASLGGEERWNEGGERTQPRDGPLARAEADRRRWSWRWRRVWVVAFASVVVVVMVGLAGRWLDARDAAGDRATNPGRAAAHHRARSGRVTAVPERAPGRPARRPRSRNQTPGSPRLQATTPRQREQRRYRGSEARMGDRSSGPPDERSRSVAPATPGTRPVAARTVSPVTTTTPARPASGQSITPSGGEFGVEP
jgi:hypothetical protein